MGMYCDGHDHFMGLNDWASNFVKGEPVLVCMEEIARFYLDGRRETLEFRPIHESSVKKEKSGELYFGMFRGEYRLHKHTFPDGRVYFEKVQAETWSFGPVFFLALQDKNGNWLSMSLWAEEVIEAG